MSNLISSKDKKKSRENIVWIDDEGNFRNTHLFCKTGEYFMENNLYTRHQPGSPEYDNFWITQEEKCREGVTIGEVSITGYNYFYLNYYMMQNTISDPLDPVKSKRVISRFPRFYRFQYNVFQIIDYIQKNGYNLSIIKPRGCGLSEIAASIGVRDYTFSTKENGKIVKHKKIFYFAADKDYLDRDGILTKCWSSMEFLSNYTDWFHARMKLDTKIIS